MNNRKNFECKANVSWRDIHNCWDLVETYPLCIEHRRTEFVELNKKPEIEKERELMTMYLTCPECKKLLESYHNSLLKICRQLSEDLQNFGEIENMKLKSIKPDSTIKKLKEKNKFSEEQFRSGRKEYKNIFGTPGKYFNSREEAEFFRRSGDRIYYDPYIGKYYIVRVEDPFWG